VSTPNGEKPDWSRDGMTPAEAAVWEAAQRAADSAPEIRRGDEVWMDLRPLVAGWLKPAAVGDRAA
jgi:hypothetical protein